MMLRANANYICTLGLYELLVRKTLTTY